MGVSCHSELVSESEIQKKLEVTKKSHELNKNNFV